MDSNLTVPPGARIALVATRFNHEIVARLLEGARDALYGRGGDAASVREFHVPGAWELPSAAQALARAGYAAVVALGCVIRGQTRHYEHVADQCAAGLMRVQLETGVPVANAVLAVEREHDAWARAGGAEGNKGEDAALAALAMLKFARELA
ncbi:MAG TPA: 6,7-dimethyl-8-ribityllumazine synthase [Xanthomonadaceae bacterium]|nr:6,7-dimethyl-8-ribityllumazine synthase [Xanthomonadaceae bacterium]